MVDDDFVGAFVTGSIGLDDGPDAGFGNLGAEVLAVFEGNLLFAFSGDGFHGIAIVDEDEVVAALSFDAFVGPGVIVYSVRAIDPV